jgi:hypothetical protein
VIRRNHRLELDTVESGKNEQLYYEAVEEHHVVDLVLREIKDSSEGSEEFDAKAKVLPNPLWLISWPL